MKDRKQVVDCIGGSARLARAQIGDVKRAIDAGDLIRAELELYEAEALLGAAQTISERRVTLDLLLQGATIAQYRGNFGDAGRLAATAVEYADRHFGPRGLEIGRARLHQNFALEAVRDFKKALRKNLELDDELVSIPGSQAIRLNCLTRAVACAVKNADRPALRMIGLRSEPLREGLTEDEHARVIAWHLFWCAVASLRQNRYEDAMRLLDYGEVLVAGIWRWENAADFVQGYGLSLEPRTKALGVEMMTSARCDAEQRGFHGHVRSIDAGFAGPGCS